MTLPARIPALTLAEIELANARTELDQHADLVVALADPSCLPASLAARMGRARARVDELAARVETLST